jgi:hypothetical protein
MDGRKLTDIQGDMIVSDLRSPRRIPKPELSEPSSAVDVHGANMNSLGA